LDIALFVAERWRRIIIGWYFCKVVLHHLLILHFVFRWSWDFSCPTSSWFSERARCFQGGKILLLTQFFLFFFFLLFFFLGGWGGGGVWWSYLVKSYLLLTLAPLHCLRPYQSKIPMSCQRYIRRTELVIWRFVSWMLKFGMTQFAVWKRGSYIHHLF